MKSLQCVRGVRDILGVDAEVISQIINTTSSTCHLYGYNPIILPVLEKKEVFTHTLGETSDVVTKEMYSFVDGEEHIVLRPEGTASCVRALCNNRQAWPWKYWYCGPMFRRERPQAGRYRQFTQLGCEYMSNKKQYYIDVEAILVAAKTLEKLGILQHVSLEINTIGDKEDRIYYTQKLKTYLATHIDNMSPISQIRYKKNPLRILDSKEPLDMPIIMGAPKIIDCLSEHSRSFFESVLAELDYIGVDYKINPLLVRGLDYYENTVFEFVPNTDVLGSCNTILGGGGYSDLPNLMGFDLPNFYACGWAMGVERTATLTQICPPPHTPKQKFSLVIAVIDSMYNRYAYEVLNQLVENNIPANVLLGDNASKQTKKADQLGATHVIFIGGDEQMSKNIVLKNMSTGQQNQYTLEQLIQFIHKAVHH